MKNRDMNTERPAHLIDYDPIDPSPEFTQEQIKFIESVRAHISGEDLAALRRFEWFQLNLNWKQFGEPPLLGYGAVPGLRDGPGVGTLYVRRFSSDRHAKMMDSFLDYIPEGFPEGDVRRCHMPGYRLETPNTDVYYPIVFNGNITEWRRRLTESSKIHHTVLGEFDNGKFVLPDGKKFSFGALKLDRLKSKVYPKDW